MSSWFSASPSSWRRDQSNIIYMFNVHYHCVLDEHQEGELQEKGSVLDH